MNFKTSDGVRLDYLDVGQGQPFICLPGIGSSRELWGQVVAQLKLHYRVILLDPRNQGLSERTYKGQRMSRHALDLEELLQKCEIQHAIGLGNSMGASTLFAYLSLFSAKRFAAMIDIDQSPKMIADKTWPYGFKQLTWSNFPNYMKLEMGQAAFAHIDDEVVDKARQEAAQYPYDAESNFDLLADHSFQDWRDVIMDTPIPLLIVSGDHSPYFDHNFAKATAKLSDKVSSGVIANAGHLIQAEQPTVFIKTVFAFLSKNDLI